METAECPQVFSLGARVNPFSAVHHARHTPHIQPFKERASERERERARESESESERELSMARQ